MTDAAQPLSPDQPVPPRRDGGALPSAAVTVEWLVARDIDTYRARRTARRASRRAEHPEALPIPLAPARYHGATGFDPAITGEPPEEQAPPGAHLAPRGGRRRRARSQ